MPRGTLYQSVLFLPGKKEKEISVKKHTEFQHFLYCKFYFEKKYSAQEVARKMNMPASTLYHYIEGEITFPADLVSHLYNATQDPDILNFIINNTRLMLVSKQTPTSIKSVPEETPEATSAHGDVVRSIQESIRDGKIDSSEVDQINSLINRVEKELEDLRHCVTSRIVGNGKRS